MEKKLFTPFIYIAGSKALVFGLIAMLVASSIGYLNALHFDGVLDVHTGMNAKYPMYIIENIINWIITVVVFYILGLIFSKSAVRIIDIMGTFALARYPLLFSSFMGFVPFNHLYLSNPFSIWLMAYAFILLLIIIWMVVLLYNAYQVSCNLKGFRLVFSFMVGIIAAELLSKISILWLYKHY